MGSPTAFRATYADWKLIRTRQAVQIVFEIPLSDADAAYDVLGGMPDSSRERWFGIAPIKASSAEKVKAAIEQKHVAKRDWRDLPPPQQSGIRCAEPVFAAFLKEQYPEEWRESGTDAAVCVRLICAVQSRSDLAEGKPRVIWHQLDSQYQAWKALEHA